MPMGVPKISIWLAKILDMSSGYHICLTQDRHWEIWCFGGSVVECLLGMQRLANGLEYPYGWPPTDAIKW